MSMTLTRKGILDHIRTEKKENETMNDGESSTKTPTLLLLKALKKSTRRRLVMSDRRNTHGELIRDCYDRNNLQNHIALTRRLREFQMEERSIIAAHLDTFGEIVLAMEVVGDPIDQSRQLVILLGKFR